MCPTRQELAVTNEGSRNYRGIFISIFVLLGMSFLIIASIYCVNPDILKLNALSLIKEKITLDEVLLGDLNASPFNGQWLSSSSSSPVFPNHRALVDNQHLLQHHNTVDGLTEDLLMFEDKQNNIQLLRLKAGNVSGKVSSRKQLLHFSTLVANNSALSSLDPPMSDYHISSDNRWLLVASDRRHVYRHTFTATYFAYNISGDELIPITVATLNEQNATAATNVVRQQQSDNSRPITLMDNRLQYAMWTPQNGLILVHNNDIYYKRTIDGNAQRITYDGQLGVRFNGIPDWLYEEEILSSSHALRVSPSGTWLAFMSFDDTSVDTVHIPYYGGADTSNQLQQFLSIRYPKAGRPNPRVSVHVAHLDSTGHHRSASSASTPLQLPADLARQQHYVTDVKWLNDTLLSVAWTNRVQNVTHLLLCEQQQQQLQHTVEPAGHEWHCRNNAHQAMTGGWAEPIEVVPGSLSSTGNEYLALLQQFQDHSVGHFKHVARVSVATGHYTFLTTGHFEVTQINAYDAAQERVIYTATRSGAPDERHAYQLDTRTMHTECLTCHMPAANECTYNEIKVAPSMQYFILECMGPGVPRIQLRAVRPLNLRLVTDVAAGPAVANGDGSAGGNGSGDADPDAVDRVIDTVLNDSRLVWVIEHNHELREKLKLKALPQVRQFMLPIEGTHYNASVQLLLPAQLKPEEATQYPMIVSVYAGPQSQRVDSKFFINYGHYLASGKKIIYAMIDGRGSGYQGTRLAFEVYHKLGSVEIDDQLQVTRQLLQKFPFIDPHKVAIWGWSYGGYASSMALARGLPTGLSMGTDDTSADRLMGVEPQLKHTNLTTTMATPPTTTTTTTSATTTTTTTASARVQRKQQQLLPSKHVLSSNGQVFEKAVFECAVSVAPVTDWIYYDTAYTERYMGSPYVDESFGGEHGDTNSNTNNNGPPQSLLAATSSHKQINERYKRASLVEQAANVNMKRLLLVHGTADDNVHFQQSIMLMKALTRRNVLYETQLYPDENHGIDHRTSKMHLYTTLDHFFTECFEFANPSLVFSPSSFPPTPIHS